MEATIQQKIISDKLGSFVGRQKYIEYYVSIIDNKINHNQNIIGICGIGGIGKTSLINKFQSLAVNRNLPVVQVNGSPSLDPLAVLQIAREQLGTWLLLNTKIESIGNETSLIKPLVDFDKAQVIEVLIQYFDKEDITGLCKELGIKYREWTDNDKLDNIQNILAQIEKKQLNQELLTKFVNPKILTISHKYSQSMESTASKSEAFFLEFDNSLKLLSQIRNKLTQKIGEKNVGFANFRRENPAATFLLDKVDENVTTKFLSQYLSLDEAKTYLNADNFLTTAFGKCITNITNYYGQIIFVFDHYEAMEFLDEWLRDALVRSADQNCTFIFSGRNRLGYEWNSFGERISLIELNGLSELETLDYLNVRNITDKELCNKLFSLTKGLPWALALAADMIQSPLQKHDFSSIADEVNLETLVVEMLLSRPPKTLSKDVIEACSVVRFFDQEVVSFLLDIPSTESRAVIDSLLHYSFINIRSDGKYIVHDIVREFLVNHIKATANKTWSEINLKATKYYDKKLETASTASTKWRTYNIEKLYHVMAMDKEEGFNHFFTLAESSETFDRFQPLSMLRALLSEIRIYPQENKRHSQRIRFFEARILQDQNEWKKASQKYISLLEDPELEDELKIDLYNSVGDLYCNHILKDTARMFQSCFKIALNFGDTEKQALALKKLGDAYTYQGRYDLAIQNYNKSLAVIDPNQKENVAWLLLSLAYTYRLTGEWATAFNNLNISMKQFVELENDYGTGIALRVKGQLFEGMGKTDEAFRSYTRSLELISTHSDKFNTARVMLNLGGILLSKGDNTRATSFVQESLRLFRELDAPFAAAAANTIQIEIYNSIGKIEEAEVLCKSTIDTFNNIGGAYYEARAIVQILKINLRKRDWVTFDYYFDSGKKLASEYKLYSQLSQIQQLKGISLLLRNDLDSCVMEFIFSMTSALEFNHIFLKKQTLAILKSLKENLDRENVIRISNNILGYWSTHHLSDKENMIINRDADIYDDTPLLVNDVVNAFVGDLKDNG